MNRRDVEEHGRVPLSNARGITRYDARIDDVVEALWGVDAWDW
jgi:hypothetical protein